MTDNKLIIGQGNAKLSLSIGTFSIPAGHTCPFAKECLSKADRVTGKLIDGEHCRFRCFSASQENYLPLVRKARWHNFDILKKASTIERMGQVIQESIPFGIAFMRVHVSGDFFSEKYFLAWLNVAMNNPLVTFYGYTKALPFIVKYRKLMPKNFRFVASRGGTCDSLIGKYHLRSAEVVFSPEEAAVKNLEIDHEDNLAILSKKSFALLLHGTQPEGSKAGKAVYALRTRGIGGYGDSKISRNRTAVRPALQVFVTLKDREIYLPQVADTLPATLPQFLLVENGEFYPSWGMGAKNFLTNSEKWV